MAIAPFLAAAKAEMEHWENFPEKTAWLGCHFSPYGSGLSNLPPALPPGSLLILDDANPIAHHDPVQVIRQVEETVLRLECTALLLDFQRQNQPGAAEMAQALTEGLPCPVAVSSLYAGDLDCPVFLPPVPPSVPLADVLWKDRECWLELALDGEAITLTEQGAALSPLLEIPEGGFTDERLHCHYALTLQPHQARWTLWRTREDLQALLAEAEALGVTAAVGLWQEFKNNGDAL